MTTLDRAVQRRILEGLRDSFPGMGTPKDLGFQQNDRAWTFNVMYLAQHDLVDASLTDGLDGPPIVLLARINARGIDFLEADGGLSAILNLVTVRFDADSLKALMAARVDESALPPEEKSKLKKKLLEMGEDALKEVTKRLLGAALDQGPAALQLLQNLLG